MSKETSAGKDERVSALVLLEALRKASAELQKKADKTGYDHRSFESLGTLMERLTDELDRQDRKLLTALKHAVHVRHPKKKKIGSHLLIQKMRKEASFFQSDSHGWKPEQTYSAIGFCFVMMGELNLII